MQLTNEFEVPTPIDDVWALLLDLERVIPCMPGAALLGREDETVKGSLKVKVGPIAADFAGVAKFVDTDPVMHRAVIAAEGNDRKGRNAAKASIVVSLSPLNTSTHVRVETDLTLSGKLAQFGRGAIADISDKLLGEFTRNLEAELGAPTSNPDLATHASPGGAIGLAQLLSVAGPVLLKRAAAPVLVLTVLTLALYLRRQRLKWGAPSNGDIVGM